VTGRVADVRSTAVPEAAGARRRVARWVLLLAGALTITSATWIVVTALMARAELTAAKADLGALRQAVGTGDIAGARRVAARLSERAGHAHSLTTGPAWFAAASIPGVGDPLTAARGATGAVDTLSKETVPALIDLAAALGPARFRVAHHRIDLTALIRQTEALDEATRADSAQRRILDTLPRHTWLSRMDAGVAELRDSVGTLSTALDTVDRAAHVAPTMLGYRSPQRYFFGLQNEAEARGSGGLPGAFGIVVADHGRLTFTHFGSDSELVGVRSGVALGADYEQQWRDFAPADQFLNSTVSPHFPDAARIWAGMWQRKTGQHIDGALSLDPTALSYFLASTGPLRLPDGAQVTSRNVVSLTESTVYAKYATDNATRKAYVVRIAQAVDGRILDGGLSPAALLRAAARAAGERRLLVWHTDPDVEATLIRGAVGGAIPTTAAPFASAFVNNYAANKLDYYLRQSLSWTAEGCGPIRSVAFTLTLTNDAPGRGLPQYVIQRTDAPAYSVKAGDNRVMVQYIGTNGGSFRSGTVNGRQTAVLTGHLQGHPTYGLIVEVPRGASTTVRLTLAEPASRSAPIVVRQPTVRPGSYSVRSSCR
jgi:hypothetical protein